MWKENTFIFEIPFNDDSQRQYSQKKRNDPTYTYTQLH